MARITGAGGWTGVGRALAGGLISIVPWGLAAAGETKTARKETVEGLAAAYGKLEGYIAIYHFQGPAKTAEITLAMDVASGLGVLQLVGSKDGHRNELRQWSTRDGTVYFDDGNSLKRMDAYMAGYQLFKEFNRQSRESDPRLGIRTGGPPIRLGG